MRVTEQERATFEEIRLKMLAEQDAAMQDFAALMARPETEAFVAELAEIKARCTAGSTEATQIGNILLVLNAVTQQFPLKEKPDTPPIADAPAQ